MANRIRLSKGQTKQLYESGVGAGFIAYRSADKEITWVEFYTDPSGTPRRVEDGRPLFPLTVEDENDAILAANLPF